MGRNILHNHLNRVALLVYISIMYANGKVPSRNEITKQSGFPLFLREDNGVFVSHLCKMSSKRTTFPTPT